MRLAARVEARPRTLAFAIYTVAGLAFFGRPLLVDPARQCVCIAGTTDQGPFIWSFQWWPHALVHGLNPFYTHILYAPEGFDLAHGGLAPGAALLLSPLTAVAGPFVSYNVAMLAGPILAAFFTFLLCRRLTRRFLPALVGGWLFGFSSYMLGQLTGHLNLTLVFLAPAIVHLFLRALASELRPWRFGALMTGALTLQFLFSAELFLTFAMFGAVLVALGYLLADRTGRARLRRVSVFAAGAYAATGVVVSPYLYYALKPGTVPVVPKRAEMFSNDLLSFAFPTPLTRLGHRYFEPLANTFTAGFVEGGAYLGFPLLAMVCIAAVTAWERYAVRLLVVFLIVVVIASLGSYLHVAGIRTIPLPWKLFHRIDPIGVALPARFIVYGVLAAAVLAALWLAASTWRARWRYGLAVLAILFLAPTLGHGYWRSRPEVPRLFATTAYKRHIRPADTVLILPVGIAGQSMLWHASAHLDFKLAGGYVVPPEASDPYKGEPIYPTLTYFAPVANMVDAARRFLAAHRVDIVVLSPHNLGPWPGIMKALHWRETAVGGVLLFRPQT